MIINVHEFIKESFVQKLTSLFPNAKVEYFVESVEIEGSDKLTNMMAHIYPELSSVELFQNLNYTNLLGRRVRHETFFNTLSVKLIFYVGQTQIKFHITEHENKLYIMDNKVLNLNLELTDRSVKNKDNQILDCNQDDFLKLFCLSFYGNHIEEWYQSIEKTTPKKFGQVDLDFLLTHIDEINNFILVKEMVMA